MPVISDDLNAVDSTKVGCLCKPEFPHLWYLNAIVEGAAVTWRFPSTDARDEFYKKLVEAMAS